MALARLGYHAVRSRPLTVALAAQTLCSSSSRCGGAVGGGVASSLWPSPGRSILSHQPRPPSIWQTHRHYRHMAGQSAEDAPTPPAAKPPATTPSKPPKPSGPSAADDPLRLSLSEDKTAKEQRKTDWTIVKRLIGHVWPKGETGAKTRVVLALGLLVGGKVSPLRCPTSLSPRFVLTPLALAAPQRASPLLLQEHHRQPQRRSCQAARLC